MSGREGVYMRRVVTAAVGVSAMLALAVPGTAAAKSAAKPTDWPSPGAGANNSVKPVSITGDSLSLQYRREPLVLVGEEREGKKRLLTLSNDVLFAKDSAELSSASRKNLDEVAERIKDSGAKGPVEVVGHTDTDGSKAYNKKLSTDRAEAVVAALKPRLSGTDTKLQASGKGETDLAVKPEETKADKAQNRRVTITYTTTKAVSQDEDDEYDISVPPTQAAKEATGPPAKGSLASVERTVSYENGTEATVQLDVTTFKSQGPFLLVRMTLYCVSVPSGSDSYDDVAGLFSGNTLYTEDLNVVLYDKPEGAKLLPVINGKGGEIRSGIPDSMYEGQSAEVWFYFTPPEHTQKTLDLYVPAFGVINELEPQS